MKKMVYICSPYSGDIERNTEKAREYSRYAVEQGVTPLTPHLMLPQFISEDEERELAIALDLVFLGRCDELWVFGGRISPGMKTEIKEAEKSGITIRYISEI